MNADIAKMVRDLAEAESNVRVLTATLDARRRGCKHQWGEVKYTPIIREGYQDPGDPVGTMGVDRRLPMYVPRDEKPQWTRVCSLCGLEEVTARTREETKKVPVFG
jgi:hypothetical protein